MGNRTRTQAERKILPPGRAYTLFLQVNLDPFGVETLKQYLKKFILAVAAAPAGETDAEPSVVEGATKPVHDAVEPVKDTADKAKGTGGLWEMLSGKTDKKKGGLLDMLRDTRGRAKSLLPNLSGLVDGGIVPKIID